MRILDSTKPAFWPAMRRFCRAAASDPTVQHAVAGMLAEVADEGDAAISRAVAKFDGATLKPSQFRVAPEDLAAAARRLPRAERAAIREAIACVKAFNRRSLPRAWRARNPQGARIGETFFPLRRVGLYIPRGLASTVIMTSVIAKLARVPEIALFTPCDKDGRVSDAVLGTAHLCGVSEVYRIGGVSAIGAMAFGTTTIPAVVKIFGPGNAYVVEAKRQVFGQVGVDLLPGPSEVMVIADDSANPDFVAADLLAQAEHGSGREKVFLVSTSRTFITAVHERLSAALATLGRAEAVRRVLKDGFVSIVVPDMQVAAEVGDWVAPEHLELEVEPEARAILQAGITTAGAVMLGGWSATALGDFTAGPSHELPTGRSGRFSSGLQTIDFMRRSSLVEYDERALRRAAPVVEAFARMEQLDAHGRSVTIRTELGI